jgi:hypothetical protein
VFGEKDMDYAKYFGRFNQVVNDLEIPVKFFFGPTITACPNCIVDTFGGVLTSTGVYKNGGPIPFEGVCPYCDGRGFTEIETSQTINCRVYFLTQRDGDFNIPKLKFSMHSPIESFDVIKRCSYCVPQDGAQNLEFSKYQLDKAPAITNFKLNPVKYVESHWVKM